VALRPRLSPGVPLSNSGGAEIRRGTGAVKCRHYLTVVAASTAHKASPRSASLRHWIFRHTYAATSLQTLDRGTPVSLYTVSRELGHDSEEMVRRV
jgi:integrase